MEQIVDITQDKVLEIPNDQNRINHYKEAQIKFNRNKNIISGDGSKNRNKRESEQNQNNFEGPKPVPRKFIRRSAAITNPENKQDSANVRRRDNQSRGNYKLKEKNILGEKSQAIQASLFPFGMIQTPFQIMLNHR